LNITRSVCFKVLVLFEHHASDDECVDFVLTRLRLHLWGHRACQ